MPPDSELQTTIAGGLPGVVPVGRGTSYLLRGTVAAGGERIRSVELQTNGKPQDLAGLVDAGGDEIEGAEPGARSWWAIADLPRTELRTEVRIALEASVGGRRRLSSDLGTLDLYSGFSIPNLDHLEAAEREDGSITGALPLEPRVFLAVAVRSPDIDRLRLRVESLRAQSYRNWRCFVRDCGSSPEEIAAMRELLGDDDRFELFEGTVTGLNAGIGQALTKLSADAPYIGVTGSVAAWHPEALETMLEAFTPEANAVLGEVAGSAGDGDEHGEGLGELAGEGAIAPGGLIFRRELLPYVLPLPPIADVDSRANRWIAMVARALGAIQHAELPNADGAADRTAAAPGEDAVPIGPDGKPRTPLEIQLLGVAAARTLETRCSPYLTSRGRRQLRRINSGSASRIARGRAAKALGRG